MIGCTHSAGLHGTTICLRDVITMAYVVTMADIYGTMLCRRDVITMSYALPQQGLRHHPAQATALKKAGGIASQTPHLSAFLLHTRQECIACSYSPSLLAMHEHELYSRTNFVKGSAPDWVHGCWEPESCCC